MVLPMNFWLLFAAAMLISSIGFKNYVWFISLGYGFSIAGEGLLLLLLYGKTLTPGTIICCILFIIYGCRLGGYLAIREFKSSSYKKNMVGEIIGSVTNYGIYKDAFNTKSGASKSFSGDFHTHYTFNNFHSSNETKNWNNFIIKNTINGKTGFIRADAYQFDSEGTFTFKTSWGDDWETFVKMLTQAKVDIDIERIGTTIIYTCDIKSYDGLSGTMTVTQDGITAQSIGLSLTEEASQIDILEIMDLKTVETGIIEDPTIAETVEADKTIVYPTITDNLVNVRSANLDGTATLHSSNGETIAIQKATKGIIEFDMSNLPNGVYVVVADGKAEKIIKK